MIQPDDLKSQRLPWQRCGAGEGQRKKALRRQLTCAVGMCFQVILSPTRAGFSLNRAGNADLLLPLPPPCCCCAASPPRAAPASEVVVGEGSVTAVVSNQFDRSGGNSSAGGIPIRRRTGVTAASLKWNNKPSTTPPPVTPPAERVPRGSPPREAGSLLVTTEA